MTVEEVVEEFLEASGAPRNGLNWSSIADDGEAIQLVASSRKTFNHFDIEAAGRVVIDALYRGGLNGYARDEADREYYRLRRDYWQDIEITDEGCVQVVPPFSCRDGEWRDGVLGQPILIARTEFDDWKKAGLIAYGVASAAKKPASARVREYVRRCIEERLGKEATCSKQALEAAFPQNLLPSRSTVRAIYDEEHGGEIRRGRPTAA
jgi:hypothetical protein